MSVTDPYPGQPTDGQSLDAVPILAKFNALFQGIQSFDGSQIQAGTVAGSAMATSVNPNTLLKETESPFVQTGCVWSSVSGLQGTMSSGVAYIANASSMFRVSVTGVGSYTFTASKDTYIDIDYNGNIYYQAVANGASAPALTSNSVRIARVVTNASAISSVVQYGIDTYTFPNPIYPTRAVNLGTLDPSSAQLNIRSASNSTNFNPVNGDNNLGSSCQITLTTGGPIVALVTANVSIESASDSELHPEIWVDGSLYHGFTPAATTAISTTRAVARTTTWPVVINTSGSHTISAGIFVNSGSSYVITIGGAEITALIVGKVTA